MRPAKTPFRDPVKMRFAQCLQASEKNFNFFQPVAERALGDAHLAPESADENRDGKPRARTRVVVVASFSNPFSLKGVWGKVSLSVSLSC